MGKRVILFDDVFAVIIFKHILCKFTQKVHDSHFVLLEVLILVYCHWVDFENVVRLDQFRVVLFVCITLYPSAQYTA